MGVISRMMLVRIAGRSLAVFVFVGVIILTTQVLNQASKLVEASSSLWLVARLMALFVPTISVVILPIAFLIAVMQTYDSMDESLETVVVRATGAGPWLLLAPSVLMASLIAGVVLLTSVFVEPAANRAVRDLLGAVQLDAIQIIATDGVLREIEPGLFVQGGARSASGKLEGIFIFDRRRPSGEILYVAESGALVRHEGKLQLEIFNGTLLVRNRAGGEEQRVSFGRYVTEPESFFGNPETLFGARQTATFDLIATLKAAPDARTRSELVRRFTDWLYAFVYMALVAALTARAVPSALSAWRRWRLPVAVMVGGGVRVAGLALIGPAGTSLWALVLAFAMPLGLLTGLAAFAVWRAFASGRGPKAAGVSA